MLLRPLSVLASFPLAGQEPVRDPLVDEAVSAARAFVATDAFGSWLCPSANKAIRKVARKANRDLFSVYQIRHSFVTWLRHAGADLADTRESHGHTDAETMRIYVAPTLAKQRRRNPRAAGRGPSRGIGRGGRRRARPSSPRHLTALAAMGEYGSDQMTMRRRTADVGRLQGTLQRMRRVALRGDLTGRRGRWNPMHRCKLLILKHRRVAQLVRAPA